MMKIIHDDLLELISGGYAPRGTDEPIPSVTVTGNYTGQPYYQGPVWNPNYNWNPNTGTGIGPFSDPEPCTTHSSPAPGAIPQGVTLETIRDAMQYVAHQMEARPEYTAGLEQMSFLWRNSYTGNLWMQEVITGSGTAVTVDLQPPTWEDHVIAMIHSHPPGTSGLPSSPGDSQGPTSDTEQWNLYAQGQVFDANFLSYILDSNTGHLYEYHGSGSLSRPLGNDMTTDLVLC